MSKPKTLYCRRAALIRWTGWTDEVIARLIREGKLRYRYFGSSRRHYKVESAQEIIDAE